MQAVGAGERAQLGVGGCIVSLSVLSEGIPFLGSLGII